MSIFGRNRLMTWAKSGGISPFDLSMLGNRPNECCIDVRIGTPLYDKADCIPSDRLIPGEFAKAKLLEFIKIPDDAAGLFSIRSEWGQKGLNQLMSVRIKPGWPSNSTEHLIVELHNVGRDILYLPVGTKFGQIELEDVR